MKKNIHAPRKRTSLGTLSKNAKRIADLIKKFAADCGMNMDAERTVPIYDMHQNEDFFNKTSEVLNELYQEECRSKGK